MFSRINPKAPGWANLASTSLRSTTLPYHAPAAARLASSSSKPGETVGGTKTDHTKEFKKPSRNQKSGEQHTQQPGDTVAKGGSRGAGTSHKASSGAKTAGHQGGSSDQQGGQHVGPMGSG
ncbi:hypothetical protein PFICI_01216 [Pestalotiopsis fici W106-1]|uniref:Uncharacterized protein n=1 Tax=Pestalotiopsis fici (strain W106-1 / CGMCC3.15140) TaxID=1229662 RepID=W3XMW4_PESFW|nr:uncharacterized protein PFICI_01216 [Pestalotiopsis fici W106-1]ETS87388.1 hypothetical protein PFICI_01216 [Pestalotiopsis fici W106-1]